MKFTRPQHSTEMNMPKPLLALVLTLLAAPGFLASPLAQELPRTANGHPDLSGTYDTATLTPLQRPQRFGDQLLLTDEQAAALESQEFNRNASRNEASNPNREAPPVGGDGSPGAAGNVGGYNTFWIDRGHRHFKLTDNGEPQSSQTHQTDASQQ